MIKIKPKDHYQRGTMNNNNKQTNHTFYFVFEKVLQLLDF